MKLNKCAIKLRVWYGREPWHGIIYGRDTLLVFGLRVAHVKRKTLNAFFGHSRSFAHPKPNIQNDRRDEIYNPVPFDFWFEKTCYGRELPEILFIFQDLVKS